MIKIITIVGSRQTPPEVLDSMRKVAKSCCSKGIIVRSGKAGGADAAALKGCEEYYDSLPKVPERTKYSNPPLVVGLIHRNPPPEMYIPWKGFGEDYMTSQWDSVQGSNIGAGLIAESIHPNWEACKQGAKKLHTRNVCQILGRDVDTPSDLVLFYCKEVGGKPTGGTATAVNLGLKVGCKTINMLHSNWRELLRPLLKEVK